MKKTLCSVISFVLVISMAVGTNSVIVQAADSLKHNIYINSSNPNESFSSKVNTTDEYISIYLNMARRTAKYLFKKSSGYVYDNFLWGEYDSGIGIHEGVDMHYSSDPNCNVYATVRGEILSIGGSLGRVCIYDADIGQTINYLHLNVNSNLEVGDYVLFGDVIGRQSDVGAEGAIHVHVQVESGRTTSLNAAGDYELKSTYPYYAMAYYTNETSYK